MSKTQHHGCSEYAELSRRGFLSSATLLGGALATAPAWLPQVAMAQSFSSTRDVIVSVYLRGGIDGLNCVVPYADPNYYTLRPTLAIPDPSSTAPLKAIDLDGFFGFAPAMQPLMEAYQSDDLLLVHAVGAPQWSRSHFDAQRWMETSIPRDNYATTGWLGRHLATTGAMTPGSVLRGASLTYGMVKTMNGGPNSLPIPEPQNFGLGGDWQNLNEMRSWLTTAYTRESEPMKSAAQTTQATIDLLDTIDFENYQPAGGAVYPDTWFGNSLKAAAALIRANVGVEAIHVDLDGWDTHSSQGSLDGEMRNLMQDLSNSVAAFYRDLMTANFTRFTLIALSEFGRTVAENNSAGTDHGTATSVMVLGGDVLGGRVLRQWPGLAPGNLLDGVDLAPTIDFRDLLAEILYKRADNRTLNAVFPNYTPTFQGIYA